MNTMRNSRGNAMIITLMLLIILTGLGIYAISISTTEMSMATQWKSGTIGFNAAESGVYRVYDLIGTPAPISDNLVLGSLPNGAVFRAGGNQTPLPYPAPGFSGTLKLFPYEVNSKGNAAGSTVSRELQAIVEFGPVPYGPGDS